jgi:hypothetical protein
MIAALTAAMALSACSVHSTFKTLGGIPEWRPELAAPSPEVAEPRTLAVRCFCPTLSDGDYTAQLGERIRAAASASAIGPMNRLADTTKKPHYEIVLTEAGRDGTFQGSETGGWLSGVGVGAATGIFTRNLGIALLGGAAAGATGTFGLGGKIDSLMFRVECYQYTSTERATKVTADRRVKTVGAGGAADASTGSVSAQLDVQDVVESTWFDVKACRLAWVKFFAINVKGAALASGKNRTQSAAEEILQHFPTYVFGGESLY